MSRNPENNRFPISARALNDQYAHKIFHCFVFSKLVRENYTTNKEMTARYRHKRVIQWSQVKKNMHRKFICLFTYFFTYHFIYIFFFMV